MFSPQEKENLCMVTKSKMLFCFGECCCPTGSSTQPTCNLIPWKRLCREIKLFVYTSLPYECWLYTHVTALNRVSHKLHLHWKSQQIMGKPLFGTTSGGSEGFTCLPDWRKLLHLDWPQCCSQSIQTQQSKCCSLSNAHAQILLGVANICGCVCPMDMAMVLETFWAHGSSISNAKSSYPPTEGVEGFITTIIHDVCTHLIRVVNMLI